MKRASLVALFFVFATFTVPTLVAHAQSLDKTSVHFFLQVHRGYKGDSETWSWTPKVDFRVNGPFKPGDGVSVEYSLPGKAWKSDCVPFDAGPSSYWIGIRDCGQNMPDAEAVTYTGPIDFKISLKNELEGKNSVLFAGKFKVEKFHEGVVALPKFANNNVFYVNYDWRLPIAYVYDEYVYNYEHGHPLGNSYTLDNVNESRLMAAFWFKGTMQGVAYSKYEAYLYHNGQVVDQAIPASAVCSPLDRPDSNQDSPNSYCLSTFNFLKAMLWNKQPGVAGPGVYYEMYNNPGEYEIKVLQNGHLARSAKFTFGDRKITDNGIAKQNNLGTYRILVPAAISGDLDGTWDKNAWKTDAFFGNPLTGFTLP